eukprot:8227232-Pyramimonas_sp.AAC.1
MVFNAGTCAGASSALNHSCQPVSLESALTSAKQLFPADEGFCRWHFQFEKQRHNRAAMEKKGALKSITLEIPSSVAGDHGVVSDARTRQEGALKGSGSNRGDAELNMN